MRYTCQTFCECTPIEKVFISGVLTFLHLHSVTSYHCVADTGVKEGDIVGIWGVGAIGLFCIKWALLKGRWSKGLVRL